MQKWKNKKVTKKIKVFYCDFCGVEIKKEIHKVTFEDYITLVSHTIGAGGINQFDLCMNCKEETLEEFYKKRAHVKRKRG